MQMKYYTHQSADRALAKLFERLRFTIFPGRRTDSPLCRLKLISTLAEESEERSHLPQVHEPDRCLALNSLEKKKSLCA